MISPLSQNFSIWLLLAVLHKSLFFLSLKHTVNLFHLHSNPPLTPHTHKHTEQRPHSLQNNTRCEKQVEYNQALYVLGIVSCVVNCNIKCMYYLMFVLD